MATDRQLSRDFWLHEFPCWQEATEADVARLSETVSLILQPVRRQFGAVVPTSWKWWRGGCTPRTGAHGDAGTVDFVTPDADLREVFNWMAVNIVATGSVGELIFERDHIHVTRWGVGGKGQVLVEPVEGEYVWGFVVPRLLPWLLAGGLLALAIIRLKSGP